MSFSADILARMKIGLIPVLMKEGVLFYAIMRMQNSESHLSRDLWVFRKQTSFV